MSTLFDVSKVDFRTSEGRRAIATVLATASESDLKSVSNPNPRRSRGNWLLFASSCGWISTALFLNFSIVWLALVAAAPSLLALAVGIFLLLKDVKLALGEHPLSPTILPLDGEIKVIDKLTTASLPLLSIALAKLDCQLQTIEKRMMGLAAFMSIVLPISALIVGFSNLRVLEGTVAKGFIDHLLPFCMACVLVAVSFGIAQIMLVNDVAKLRRYRFLIESAKILAEDAARTAAIRASTIS